MFFKRKKKNSKKIKTLHDNSPKILCDIKEFYT